MCVKHSLHLPCPPLPLPCCSMFLGRSPATGARNLPAPLFAACTALLWGWFAVVFWMDARARRKQATA